MRVPPQLLKAVAFVGTSDGEAFTACATGFFVAWESEHYFVTARHVVDDLGDLPFAIRMNRHDGSCGAELFDPLEEPTTWHFHPDQTVDLAVLLVPLEAWIGTYDLTAVPAHMFSSVDVDDGSQIGLADFCYAVGLFRLVAGKARNLPVVHSGQIALMPGKEGIPVEDRKTGQLNMVEGYLVELQNLRGLSGAPVFVRPMIGMTDVPMASGKRRSLILAGDSLLLLGVWTASWDGPGAGAMDMQSGLRVPVGMGTVSPSGKLADVLNQPTLKSARRLKAGG